jgi:hypothetical protein
MLTFRFPEDTSIGAVPLQAAKRSRFLKREASRTSPMTVAAITGPTPNRLVRPVPLALTAASGFRRRDPQRVREVPAALGGKPGQQRFSEIPKRPGPGLGRSEPLLGYLQDNHARPDALCGVVMRPPGEDFDVLGNRRQQEVADRGELARGGAATRNAGQRAAPPEGERHRGMTAESCSSG